MELFVAWFFCALVTAHLAVSDRHRAHRILDAEQASRGLQAVANESAHDFWERERLRADTAAIEADTDRVLSKLAVQARPAARAVRTSGGAQVRVVDDVQDSWESAARPSSDESLDNARMKLWLHLRKNRF